jgi:hypothetical protein
MTNLKKPSKIRLFSVISIIKGIKKIVKEKRNAWKVLSPRWNTSLFTNTQVMEGEGCEILQNKAW